MSEWESWKGTPGKRGRPEGSEKTSGDKTKDQTPVVLPGPEVVLVKLFFTNEKWIPGGIPKKENLVRVAKETQRGLQVAGSFQRVREERVDTGELTEVRNVNVLRFLKELVRAGYGLSNNIHYFEKSKGGYSQFTLVTEWVKGKETEVSQDLMYELRMLVQVFGWESAKLWKNPYDPVSKKTVWTVNLLHIIPPEKAREKNLTSLSFDRWVRSGKRQK